MTAAAGRKLIVAILGRGEAHRVAETVHAALGLDAFHFGHGRGAGTLAAIAPHDMVEIDTLSIVVDDARAEEVFAFVFEEAGIDRPGGGLLFQAPLARAAALGLPLPPEEKVADLSQPPPVSG